MRRTSLAAVASAMALTAVAWGHAATPTDVPLPSNPALALAALDRKIADLGATEQSDKLEIARAGAQIGSARARVLARGRAFYKLTRAGLLPVGGGFDSLVTYAMRVERMRRLLARDLGEEARLRARAVDLSSDIERIARDRVAFASQRSAMDAARQAMLEESRRQADAACRRDSSSIAWRAASIALRWLAKATGARDALDVAREIRARAQPGLFAKVPREQTSHPLDAHRVGHERIEAAGRRSRPARVSL